MKNILLTYMDERHKEKIEPKGEPAEGGPIITISREYGCPTQEIAEKLEKKLNSNKVFGKKKKEWKIISKEILYESAKELDLKPEKLEYIFKFEKKTVMDEVLGALSSRYYKSDKKIRNTIKEIIRKIACRGNVVFIGRGGVSITQDFKNALHVRLEAPLYWRAQKIREAESITYAKAEELTKEMDENRKELIEEFYGKKIDNTVFDVILNLKTFTTEQITDSIVKVMQIQNMI